MSFQYQVAAGTKIQLPSGQPATLPAATLLTFTSLNGSQSVVENLASDPTNFAANLSTFPSQTVISGESYAATYGADATLIVGADVGPTPLVVPASSSRATTTLTIVFSVAMDSGISNKAGIVVVGDGATLTVNSISISGSTMTVTLSGSSSATLMTFSYIASQGTLASAAGALVRNTGPLTIAHS